ncbi:MAG: hypothetical protein ABR985_11280 [Methanotrichaceae archaeon]
MVTPTSPDTARVVPSTAKGLVTAFSRPFRDYYTSSGTSVVGGIISSPTKYDIAQRTPSMIYYGTGQALPYSQYVSSVSSRTNELWVQGATDWSQ